MHFSRCISHRIWEYIHENCLSENQRENLNGLICYRWAHVSELQYNIFYLNKSAYISVRIFLSVSKSNRNFMWNSGKWLGWSDFRNYLQSLWNSVEKILLYTKVICKHSCSSANIISCPLGFENLLNCKNQSKCIIFQ